MTKEQKAREALLAFFESLPEKQLKTLGAKIELDRNENRFGLPHQAIITLMRPYLAAVRAPRVYTPQRIWCLPFEDMLFNEDLGYKRIGFVTRGSIAPVWKWVSEDLIPDRFATLAASFESAQKAGDEERTRDAAAAIWRESAAAMETPLTEAETSINAHDTLNRRLGGTFFLEEAREIAAVLSIADNIEAMKQDLPLKPIAVLTPDDVSVVIRHYMDVGEANPGREMYLLMIVIGRLLQPFPILRVFRSLSRKGDDSVIRTTDLSTAGEIVIEALERDGDAVVRVAQDRRSTEEEIVRKAARFAAAFKGITTDIGIRREGEWGQRMFKSRNSVSGAVEERVLNGAKEIVSDALSDWHGSSSRTLADWPDEYAFEVAERRAESLAALFRISEQLGVRANCQTSLDEIRRMLDNYSAPLVEALSRMPEEEHPQGFANLAVVARLLELVSNSDQADLLRRRGRAALRREMLDY